jgi:PAS domain S-box-containing protein
MVGAAVVGHDGTFLAVNSRWCELVEWSSSELVGRKKWQDITLPSDVAADLAMAKATRSGELPSYDMWKTYIKKSGYPVKVHIHVRGVHDQATGEMKYFLSQAMPVINMRGSERGVQVDASDMLALFLKQNAKSISSILGAVATVAAALAVGAAKYLS